MGLDDAIRIFKNVINNTKDTASSISEASQTPAGEAVITVVSIIIFSFVVLIAAVLLGIAVHAVIAPINAEPGGCAAMGIGTIIFAANADRSIGWYGIIVTIIIMLFGAALAALRFYLISEYGDKSAKKRLRKGVSKLCGSFITAIFIVSPQMYDILPLKINKWCLYITAAVLLINTADDLIKALYDEKEPDNDII